jgi:hypothetical protein
MNRILRNDGTWYKRNGPKGSGVAWFWDYLNEGLLDSVNLDTNLLQFEYTPAGVIPVGAQSDTLNLDAGFLEFVYTPAGNVPVGAYNDNLNLDSNIVNFNYTL